MKRNAYQNRLSFKFVWISILMLLMLIDFENCVAGSDGSLYTEEKSIFVRPAKRLMRIRPGTRRRILIHRVPVIKQRIPIGTSGRRIVTTQKNPIEPTITRYNRIFTTTPMSFEDTTTTAKKVPSAAPITTTETAPVVSTAKATTQRQMTTPATEGRRIQTWPTTRRSKNRNMSVLHALMR